MTKELEVVSTKVPPSVFEDIEKEVDSSKYMSISDFVRQAVREKLEKEGR